MFYIHSPALSKWKNLNLDFELFYSKIITPILASNYKLEILKSLIINCKMIN